MPVGHLFWDGGQWLLAGNAPGLEQVLQGSPQVHLDLQAGMLLSMQPVQGRTAWLWLERQITTEMGSARASLRAEYDAAVAEERISQVHVHGDFFLDPDEALTVIDRALDGLLVDTPPAEIARQLDDALEIGRAHV